MARNPYFDSTPPGQQEAIIDNLRRRIVSYLKRRSADAVVPDADIQAIHPLLAVPQVWQRIRRDLGL